MSPTRHSHQVDHKHLTTFPPSTTQAAHLIPNKQMSASPEAAHKLLTTLPPSRTWPPYHTPSKHHVTWHSSWPVTRSLSAGCEFGTSGCYIISSPVGKCIAACIYRLILWAISPVHTNALSRTSWVKLVKGELKWSCGRLRRIRVSSIQFLIHLREVV